MLLFTTLCFSIEIILYYFQTVLKNSQDPDPDSGVFCIRIRIEIFGWIRIRIHLNTIPKHTKNYLGFLSISDITRLIFLDGVQLRKHCSLSWSVLYCSSIVPKQFKQADAGPGFESTHPANYRAQCTHTVSTVYNRSILSFSKNKV